MCLVRPNYRMVGILSEEIKTGEVTLLTRKIVDKHTSTPKMTSDIAVFGAETSRPEGPRLRSSCKPRGGTCF